MKKTIIMLITILCIYVFVGNYVSKNVSIPSESIRIRVIANSNSEYDQNIKKDVKNFLKYELSILLNNSNNIDSFRETIINNVDNLKGDIKNFLLNKNYDESLNVNYGMNYFPEKEFNGTKYDAGYYESLVVKLGSGLGDNWWCVLFPPLCLLEASENEEIEYTTFTSELLKKYF